jgi:chemotaxis protein MotB
VAQKKKESGGAPEWMVTFGDMMSLLLCFFVILVSMSEMKEDEKFMKVKESIKEAFGFQGVAGTIRRPMPPTYPNIEQIRDNIEKRWRRERGKTVEEGIEGQSPSVRTIRVGLEFTIGGAVRFEPGKAVLLEHARKQLDDFVANSRILGMNNKIRVRGHTARVASEVYQPFQNLDDLTYARAQTVKQYVVGKGIIPVRITIEACGDNEPLRSQAYDDQARALNDRVSIVMSENLVGQYQGDPASEDRDSIDR